MAQIASEDYVNKLIYLHIDTVTSGFNPALMQQEHRTLRRLNAGNERNFDPMVKFVGNEDKGGGNKTVWSTRLRDGVRIVPYDTAHSLVILNEILNIPNGLANKDTFDRSSVVAEVDIDIGFKPTEVVIVATGGVSETTLNNIELLVQELHRLQGLDISNPMTVTLTNRSAGTIDLDITGDGETTTTVTRQ